MSIEASNLVWKYSQSKGSERLVMLCVANYTNQAGLAWPTESTIKADTGVSTRQITRAIASLEKSGELEIVEKGDGRGRSTVYRITLKGDTMSTIGGGEKVDMVSEKVDMVSEKVDMVSEKVDMVSTQPLEPLNNRYQPLGGAAARQSPTASEAFPFKPARQNKTPTPMDLRVEMIARLTGKRLTIPAHRRECEAAASQLKDFTPDYLERRYSYQNGKTPPDLWNWFKDFWIGQRGDMPTPAQMVDTIGLEKMPAQEQETGKKASPSRPEIYDPTMPKPGQGGAW